MYRIQQFATLAHVTVRTLHHYDRLGLLRPSHRTDNGYRLYALEDLAQLERILVLRYLGLPLRQIAELLDTVGAAPEQGLPDMLERQALVLRERRDGIDRVLRAVEHAQRRMHADTSPDWSLYQTILKEIEMQESQDWSRKYYSTTAQQTIDEQRERWNPELQAKVTEQWSVLFAKVEDAIARNIDPKSTEGKSLAAEWMGLVGEFTKGNAEVLAGLNKLYADRENWPADQQRGAPVKPELMAFIKRATAA